MTAPPVVARRVVRALGLSQFLLWGVSYYLVGVFGERIAADLGWSRGFVFGGFSAALIVMGLSSGTIGRLIDRHGGRPVMSAGSALTALACVGIALAREPVLYFAAWLVLGLAMRMTLYDAAFASLARIGGPAARRDMSQITLPGGLASTALWPVGGALADAFGWRGAVLCYAALALATVPLHLAIPSDRFERPAHDAAPAVAPRATTRRERVLAGSLFALVCTLTNILNAGMSAHMIGILTGLGAAMSLAVTIAALRGIGQSLARLAEIVFGRRLDPVALGLGAALLLPAAFAFGAWSGVSTAAGVAFAFLYGAGNGLLTITRGTQPLVLFAPHAYGALVGRLIGPSFYVSALSPVVYAQIIERLGVATALHASVAIGGLAVAASAALWVMFGDRRDARAAQASAPRVERR